MTAFCTKYFLFHSVLFRSGFYTFPGTIIKNGNKEAGMTGGIEGQALSEPDEDPFADIVVSPVNLLLTS